MSLVNVYVESVLTQCLRDLNLSHLFNQYQWLAAQCFTDPSLMKSLNMIIFVLHIDFENRSRSVSSAVKLHSGQEKLICVFQETNAMRT